jgi:subtilase family serine protease
VPTFAFQQALQFDQSRKTVFHTFTWSFPIMTMLIRRTAASLGVLACALTLHAVCAAAVTGGSKTARPMISGKVSDAQLVTLEGNTNPYAWNKSNDRGAVEASFSLDHMLLLLKRSPEQDAALKLLIDQQHLPGGANYHKWLSEAQFDEAFGVSQKDVDVVVAWLQSEGFKVNGVARSGLTIDFSGTAGQVESAFHTEIHNLQLKNGEQHISNMTDPKIPAILVPVVAGPVSLNNFFPHAQNKPKLTSHAAETGAANPDGRTGTQSDFTGGTCTYITEYKSGATTTCYAMTPGDVATVYNLTPLFTAGYVGAGATIGLIEDSNAYSANDYATFVNTFFPSGQYGASASNLSTNHPTGSTTCTNPGTVVGTDGEVEIDIEYATAAAPSASVVIESCEDTRTTFGGLIAVNNLVAGTNPPPILSISYGECESLNGATANATYYTAYQQAAAKGISVFVSSGDESSTSCDANDGDATHGIGVSAFTSTPYNVSVGGTDFSDTLAGTNTTYWNATNAANYASAKSYIPEIPWNDSCASQVIATYVGYTTTYGSAGFCNSSIGEGGFLTTGSGSGGPSNCYSGTPATRGVSNGTCAGQPKPSWQSVYGNPADGVRDVPDVSLFAANGVWNHYYVVCYSDPARNQGGAPCTGTPDTWSGFGGTSVSSPIMAGIQTLINQYVGTTKSGNGALQGNPNYVYYSLATQEYGTSGSSTCNSSLGNGVGTGCVFYDVTAGDNSVNCRALGSSTYNCYLDGATNGVGSLTNTSYSPTYNSTSGWDFATGIGSVNAYNLATSWANAFPTTTALSATPTTVNYGGSTVLQATVSAAKLDNATSGGTQVPISGTITFKDGTSTLTTCTLASATCSVTVTLAQLNNGANNITAVYGGSNAYPGSTSPVVVVTATKPDIAFTSVTHNFGNIAVGSTTTGTSNYGVMLTNFDSTAFPFSLTLTGSTAFSEVTNCGTSVAAGKSCEIIFIFAPKTAGKLTATWSVTSNGKTFAPSDGGTLTGTGLSGSVSLTTAGHNFGTVKRNKQSPTYGTVLTNGTASPVTLTLGSVTSPFLTIVNNCPAMLASGASCNLQFAFVPKTTSTVSQTFSVAANGGATPIVTGAPATTVTGIKLVGTGD